MGEGAIFILCNGSGCDDANRGGVCGGWKLYVLWTQTVGYLDTAACPGMSVLSDLLMSCKLNLGLHSMFQLRVVA